MKLCEINEEVVYEDADMRIVDINEKALQVVFKGGKAQMIGKVGMKKAGALGSMALDHLKRYDKLKAASRRSVIFYARNAQEKRTYAKMVKDLTKSKEYKVVRTFPYAGGARHWELVKVKVKK